MQETENTLRAILEQGDDVLYLGFSSALSGTYQATALLMEQLSEEYPQRTLRAEETFAASGGQGMLVYLACKKAQEGATLDEVGDFVVQTRDHLCHWFTVDDLMFLFRGGRVSRTSAWAGTMLNIKPVLHVDSKGALVPMEKVRGRKKSIKALVDHMEKTAIEPASQTVFITHGDCIEDVELLKSEIAERLGVTDFVVNYVEPRHRSAFRPGDLGAFLCRNGKITNRRMRLHPPTPKQPPSFYATPLEPKPPFPRSVSSSEETTFQTTCSTFWMTSWAMRSPGFTWKTLSGSRLISATLSSPR